MIARNWCEILVQQLIYRKLMDPNWQTALFDQIADLPGNSDDNHSDSGALDIEWQIQPVRTVPLKPA